MDQPSPPLKKSYLLWGTKNEAPDELMLKYTTADVQKHPSQEEVLFPYDLSINAAHAAMLAKQGIIGEKENETIQKGLKELGELFDKGDFALDESKEDGPSNIESFLSEKYGDAVGSMHAGKSRNDSAVTASRMYAKDAAANFRAGLEMLAETLKKKAKERGRTAMPGYTHHQPAMPTTFGKLLESYVQALARDAKLFSFALDYLDECPMGAAAGFGTSFPIDRAMVGKALGFSRVQENSIDAVTNRGEHEAVVAFAYAQAMNHLSGLAETLIIFSMPQVGFVKLDARYSTGSSMMPQKRNPDALEITKAKAALAQSCLFGMLSLGRGAFTGYNRDSQYAKKFLVDCIGECALAPQVLAGIVETLAVDAEKMAEESKKYGIGSTFEAERLATEKKMPFRQAKKLVEERVKASQGRP